jgi:hypothetical protein
MSGGISIKGMEKLEAKFAGLQPGFIRGIYASGLHIKGKIARYPASTAANSPKSFQSKGNNNWYVRGWGGKWAIKGGGWHGRRSSEGLGRKWTVTFRNSGLTVVVGNNVSYGPYVQGSIEDNPGQARALGRIGWQTTDDVAQQEKLTVERFIKSEIDKALSK